jgi:hypothetical protein
MKVMASFFEGKTLGASQLSIQEYKRALSSAEKLLDYLGGNYVVINKKEISAVSGFLCNRCIAFESRYIMEIGVDLTAEDVHKCNPSRIREISTEEDNENLGYTIFYDAVNYIVHLTNSLFPKVKYLLVNSFSRTGNLQGISARRFSEDTIGRDHWAWELLSRKAIRLTEEGLRNFVSLAVGTYMLLSVENGLHRGQHLIYVTEARIR